MTKTELLDIQESYGAGGGRGQDRLDPPEEKAYLSTIIQTLRDYQPPNPNPQVEEYLRLLREHVKPLLDRFNNDAVAVLVHGPLIFHNPQNRQHIAGHVLFLQKKYDDGIQVHAEKIKREMNTTWPPSIEGFGFGQITRHDADRSQDGKVKSLLVRATYGVPLFNQNENQQQIATSHQAFILECMQNDAINRPKFI